MFKINLICIIINLTIFKEKKLRTINVDVILFVFEIKCKRDFK